MRRQRPVGRGARPGQSLVLAISVMFLMIFMGALFVTLIARNLTRVDRSGDVSQAQQLAEAGLRYADSQLTFSDEGADWRPQLDPDWNLPYRADPQRPGRPTEQDRRLHPDWQWLTDSGAYQHPYVLFTTGEGRFLLRVSYEPTFRASAPNVSVPDELDSLSGFLHVEVVGRPGRVDSNDPTQLVNTANNPNWEPGQILGAFRKIEAWKPIGLMDQLWWVTNLKKNRGPAQFGVAPYMPEEGALKREPVQYQTEFRGGLRSNVDLTYVGNMLFKIRPGFGEGVYVAGEIRHARVGDYVPRAGVQLLDNQGAPVQTVTEGETGSGAFNPLINALTGRGHYLDNLALSNDSAALAARSIRTLEPPRIDAPDPSNNVMRYRRLTRDSGEVRRVKNPQSTEERDVNLGVYGYGAGLYVDNFDDVQYPNDRDAVVNEWLQRGPTDAALTGWVGSFYTPSIRQQGGARPVLEMVFTENDKGDPVIRLTRTDRDTEGRNFGSNQNGTRIFYAYDPKAFTLSDLGTTTEFPYPENGVIFTEGSVRVRGIVGLQGKPRVVSVVAGGTIYVEGNLLKGDPNSRLALMATDYVALNTTNFTTITPGDDVQVEGDQTGPDVKSYHYSVPPNSFLDIQTASKDPVPNGLLLCLQHSAGFEDSSSRTDLTMYVNGLTAADRYDFAGFPPPFPSTGAAGATPQPYQFFFFPPNVTPAWNQSNAQSVLGSTVNYERKAFSIPAARINAGANSINTFRIQVEPTPGGQPYWLSRAFAAPFHQPLEARIEALIYAQNGSWFVIPGPWFNDSATDRRDLFVKGDAATSRMPNIRGAGTWPNNSEDYPFYHEPLNLRVFVKGAISENMPALASERVQWTKKLWLDKDKYTISGYTAPSWYDPSIRYEYDDDFRKWVRYRNVVTGAEGMAYIAPDTPPGNANPPRLAAIRQAALAAGQNIIALPLFPRLPTGGLIYQGAAP